MPFLQTPERAARIILRGIERGKRNVHFPRRLTIPLKILGLFPGRIYDLILSRALPGGLRKKRSPEV